MPTKIQLRRGTSSEWASANPILASGEAGFETDYRRFKIGDGLTAWNALAYSTLGPNDIASAISSHLAASDPHPQYETSAEAQAKVDYHANRTDNPHAVTKSQVGLSDVPNTDATLRANHTGTQAASTISDFSSAADARIEAQKGAANGLATLNASQKIPVAQLPNSVMEYQGAYNPTTNSPPLADGSGNTGDVYRISASGSRNFGSGSITFFAGDFVIYNGSIWERSPLADGVVSVNGYQGAVTLTKADIGLGSVDNVSAASLRDRSTHTGTQLASTISDFTTAVQGVTIDAAKIDGGTVSNAEFATLDGINTGVSIQSQIDGKQATITGAATTITSSNLTASKAVVSDASGKVAVSAATSTEVGYLSGVTSGIQTQLNGKEPTISAGVTFQYWRGDKSWQTLNTTAVTEATNLYYTDTRVATYIGTQKGQPNGLASLDSSGLVPSSQLPNESIVDFGDGSDGAVTISANTTLVRDMFYSSLTINSGVTLNTAGYKLFVSGTLLNNGTISNAGGAGTAASGTTPGNGGSAAPAGTLGASSAGTNGGASGGGASTASAAVAFSMGSNGGAGGTGGAAANAVTAGLATYTPMRTASQAMLYGINLIGGGTGATGGGGGATSGTTTPGAGGGGGGGGGAVFVWASTLTNNGTITAAGGNGGNGAAGGGNGGNGGGGGGGGGGGFVFVVHGAITLGIITAAGGTGGTGGARGGGSGTAGTVGSTGTAGRVIRFNALTQAWA